MTEIEKSLNCSTSKSSSVSGIVQSPSSVYIFGGTSLGQFSGNNLGEKLDISDGMTNTWIRLKPMPSERNYFAAGIVDGIIYVIGGRNGKREAIDLIDSYDPLTNNWKAVLGIKPAFPRSEFGIATVRGKMFLIGGYGDSCRSVECFDVKRNEISERQRLQRGRWGLGVVECRGRIYACGGQWFKYRESDEESRRRSIVYLNDVETYDPVIDTWTRESSMLRRRGYFALSAIGDSIYAVGGMGGECNQRWNRRLDSIEKFDTYTKQWTMIGTHLDCGTSNLSGVVIESKLLVLGGLGDRQETTGKKSRGPGSTLLSSIQIIDPKKESVTSSKIKVSPITLTSPRHSFVALVL